MGRVLELIVGLVDSLLLAVNPVSLFVVAFIESIFFPVPPDTLLLPLVLLRPQGAGLWALICTGGSVTGAMIGYGIGRWGGQPLLKRYVRRELVEQVYRLFKKYQVWAIGIAGFTPIPYKVFTIGAGAFDMNFRLFVLVSLISRGLRFFLASFFVALYGEPMLQLMVDYFELFTVALAVVAIFFYLILRRVRSR
ncbi:MAG: YqaA family protein [Limnochordia bacterium]